MFFLINLFLYFLYYFLSGINFLFFKCLYFSVQIKGNTAQWLSERKDWSRQI